MYVKRFGLNRFCGIGVSACVKTNKRTAPIANFSHHTEARAVIENKNAAHGTIRTVWYVLYFVIARVQDGVLTFERIWYVESRGTVWEYFSQVLWFFDIEP